MTYQSKTTVVSINVGTWTDETDCSLPQRFAASRAVAAQMGERCQMDMTSITYEHLADECCATVVYVNNGCTIDDIIDRMKPLVNNNPRSYWMILDITKWQGMLDCVVSTRGTDEKWEIER